MLVEQSVVTEQSQRVQVEIEAQPSGKIAKIRLESHDANLGWYTSACINLPLPQLALLKQRLEDLSRPEFVQDNEAKIIPFPGLAAHGHSFRCSDRPTNLDIVKHLKLHFPLFTARGSYLQSADIAQNNLNDVCNPMEQRAPTT